MHLIPTGHAAGGNFDAQGGGVNYQCMPDTPEYNSNRTVVLGGHVNPAEYQNGQSGILDDAVKNQKAPCAVCDTKTRPKLMTIPAMRNCLDGWTREYEGIYLFH